MQTRPVIFVFSAVLLVPFIYAVSYIPEICAEPKDPRYDGASTCVLSDDMERMTCCWSEPDIMNPGESIIWCQTCDSGYGGNCGPVSLKKSTGSMGVPPGSVLEDPESNTTFAEGLGPNFGGVLEQPTENNMTFSKSNVPFPQANVSSNDSSSNNDSALKLSGEIEQIENKTITEEDEEKQNEGDTTEEDDGQEQDEDNDDEN